MSNSIPNAKEDMISEPEERSISQMKHNEEKKKPRGEKHKKPVETCVRNLCIHAKEHM